MGVRADAFGRNVIWKPGRRARKEFTGTLAGNTLLYSRQVMYNILHEHCGTYLHILRYRWGEGNNGNSEKYNNMVEARQIPKVNGGNESPKNEG